MIEINGLSKHYGTKKAVEDVTFTARPGRRTGFLGPNGAGKSSTLRILLGLDAATGGTALIDGKRYRYLKQPLRTVGTLLDGAGPCRPNRPSRASRGSVPRGMIVDRHKPATLFALFGAQRAISQTAGGDEGVSAPTERENGRAPKIRAPTLVQEGTAIQGRIGGTHQRPQGGGQLGRCRGHGEEGFGSWVGGGLLVANLSTIARHLATKDRRG